MWAVIIALVVISFTMFYVYVKHYKMCYWRRLGVTEDPGMFPFGSKHMTDMLLQRISFIQLTDHAYNSFPDAPFVGTYDMLGTPSLVVRDLDLAKNILIKDFDKFVERKPITANGYHPNSKNNPYLPHMLTELHGDQWRKVRASLTPAFTSGKLKTMVALIHGVADHCDGFLEKKALLKESFEAKDLMRDFAMDVIVSTGFGYNSDSFSNPTNVFKKNADQLVGKSFNLKMILVFFLFIFAPRILRWLDWPFLNKEAEKFFAAAIMKAIKDRQASGERRNDFIDIFRDILKKEAQNAVDGTSSNFTQRKEQQQTDSDIDKSPDITNATKDKKEEQHRLKENQGEVEKILISNSLLMFIAGFDTVSSSSAIMLYFLAKNPEYQERLYNEISEALESAETKGQLDYAAIMNLQYMEQFFQESLRLYPLTHLERSSATEYKLPGTDVIIPKDTMVRFSATAVVKDPKYFPDPEAFNPENFSAEKKSDRHPLASGGFGHGPRNCIAQRFATLEVKIVIARIVQKYRVLSCEKTVEKLVPDPKSRSAQPKGGVWVTVEKR